VLQDEYLVAMHVAEIRWLRSIVGELESGKLAWSADALRAFADDPDAD
jgi:hypothetical protein